MSGPLLRNWFVPRDGINRQVISADIQKYLGNDATVRPGKGEVKGKEVEGYWIKAYRNLTTEMTNDLRLASTKWEQEQRSGKRGNYEDSHTYRQTTDGGSNGHYRASTNSPQLDGPYPPPGGHGVPPRMTMPEMSVYDDARNRMYPPPPHSGAPVTTSYVEAPLYASHPSRPTPNGYGPQGDFFAAPPGYGHEAVAPHLRGPPPPPPPQYSPQYVTGHRDPRDDPRYPQEYQDQMRGYAAYPPASLAPSASIPQASSTNYSQPRLPQYEQYGRPAFAPQPQMPDQSYSRPSPSVDPSYGRERPAAPSGADARGAPRRRMA